MPTENSEDASTNENAQLEKILDAFRRFAEASAKYVIICDSDGRLKSINDSLTFLLSNHPVKFIPGVTTVYDYVYYPDRERVSQLLGGLSAANRILGFRSRVISLNGGIGWMDWIIEAECGDGACVTGFRGVGIDVSELGVTKDALTKIKTRYQHLVETMNQGFAEVDEHLNMILVNQRLCDMIGYTSSELIGTNALDLVMPEDKQVSS